MTKDIIKLAREVGLQFSESLVKDFSAAVESTYQDLIKQAVLAEREACAKLCGAINETHIESYGDYLGNTYAAECANAIRARGTT